jgi:hypothetical protein
MLICPNNNKKSAEEEEAPKPKKRAKKGAAAEEAKPAAVAVKCDYSRSIPTPEWITQARSEAVQQEAG